MGNHNLIPGHEDMKRKEIFGFNAEGHALVDYGDEGLKTYKLWITPTGTVHGEPFEQSEDVQGVDQVGGRQARPTLAMRMRGVDQA